MCFFFILLLLAHFDVVHTARFLDNQYTHHTQAHTHTHMLCVYTEKWAQLRLNVFNELYFITLVKRINFLAFLFACMVKMSYIAIIIMGFTNWYFQIRRGKCSPKIRYFPSSTSRSSYSFHMKWNEIRMWIHVYNMFMAFIISKYCALIKYHEA